MLLPALPILIAMAIAFAADSLAPAAVPRSIDVAACLTEAIAGLAVAAGVATGLGLGLTAAVRRRGYPTISARRGFVVASYMVQAMNLTVYAWLIYGLGWTTFVREGLGLRGAFVLDEFLIFLPFLAMEVLGWLGLYPAARASGMPSTSSPPLDYLIRKARLSFGMVLPIVLIYWVGNDVARRIFGDSANSPATQIGVMACLGATVLMISPAFVRFAWPAAPLPRGPIRDRLERLAKRFGFRYTDILVLDTDGMVFNALITGALPWFRYVMLSDALIDHLDDHEIAAVFGHEMGHVHHRHISYFGLFCLGSLGVMAIVSQGIDLTFSVLPTFGLGLNQTAIELAKSVIVLGVVGVYYWLVFGALSRRFERQADVFGCHAVSCGRQECPPHADYDTRPGNVRSPLSDLCPVGIRICIHALETVALENGIRPEARSWRHGSIARRIEFLRSLEGRPAVERRFQLGVSRLRLLLVLMLASITVLALLSGAFESLRGV
jgi:STE24 endopeptidase